MGEIILWGSLRAGKWEKMVFGVFSEGRDRQDKVGCRITAVVDTRLVVAPLAHEVEREAGSGDCHHFRQRCRGCRVFVSVRPDNSNMLHTNLNCMIVQDSTKSTYDMNILQDTTKSAYDVDVPRKTRKKLP